MAIRRCLVAQGVETSETKDILLKSLLKAPCCFSMSGLYRWNTRMNPVFFICISTKMEKLSLLELPTAKVRIYRNITIIPSVKSFSCYISAQALDSIDKDHVTSLKTLME